MPLMPLKMTRTKGTREELRGNAAPDPGSRHDKRQTGGSAFVFPSTKGEEPRGTLGCVGPGANEDLGCQYMHGRGLAHKESPSQRQRQSSKTRFPPSLKLAVSKRPIPVTSSADRCESAGGAVKRYEVGHERF